MTNRFGSTKMPTARDKRRQSRKLYRQMRRSWRDAASQERTQATAPSTSPAAESTTAGPQGLTRTQKATPACALSVDHVEDDAESDNKHRPSPRHAPTGGMGPSSRRIMTKASRLEQAALRRVTKLKRGGQCSLGPLDSCTLLEIASYTEAMDLHMLLRVNRRWRWTLQAHDSYLWKPHCTAVWSGRFISRPELLPFVHSAAASLPADPESRSASPTAEAPPGDFAQWGTKPPQSWREALCRSIAQGRSTTLSSSELAAGSWQIAFKLDPSIPPQRIQFFNTPMPHVKTPGFPQMPWALYQGGTVLHVHVFPEQAVTRDPTTWMWSMGNRFVGIAAVASVLAQQPVAVSDLLQYIPPAYAPTPTAPLQTSSDSEASDSGEPAEIDRPYATDRSDVDPDQSSPSTPCESGAPTPMEYREPVTLPLAAELQRFLSKPRETAGRDRSLPVVSGHGGDCDGGDPPPFAADAAAGVPCVHTAAFSEPTGAAACGAGRSISLLDNGTTLNIQQVGSRLSLATCALFDSVMVEEHAMCARSKELCAFQALGTVRLLDHAPRRMRLNFPAHLLDQGRPRKPP